MFASSCKKHTKEVASRKVAFEIDSSKIVVLDLNVGVMQKFKDYKFARLSKEDLMNVEHVLIQSVLKYNTEAETLYRLRSKDGFDLDYYKINLSPYRRQYVPMINEKGQKEVWVNCFCNKMFDPRWKFEVHLIADETQKPFNLMINLSTDSVSDFNVREGS